MYSWQGEEKIKPTEKPQEEKTHFAIHLVCAKRLFDEILETDLMTVKEVENIISDINDAYMISIPLSRKVKVQTAEYCNDTFVVTRNLAESLDSIKYGVWEGFEVK